MTVATDLSQKASNFEDVFEKLDADINDEKIMENIEFWAEKSKIAQFYKDKHIFVTGATGFMGIILVEKLLRACPGLGALYLLLRPKKAQNIQDRLRDFFDHKIFDRVKRIRGPNFFKKVILINGDVELPNLGMSDEDFQFLSSKVEIIFHGAANVKFKAPLANLVKTNIKAVQYALKLAKNAPNLKAFVHVSTAYCNCVLREIKEVIYKPTCEPEKIIEIIEKGNPQELQILTSKILGEYPNGYAFTKQIAESLLKDCGLPACVFRPAIVTTSNEEPIAGWCMNLGGPMFLCVGIMSGIIRAFLGHPNNPVEFIPVDLSVNAMLASAVYVADSTPVNKYEPIVLNNVSARNPVTWGSSTESGMKIAREIPTVKAIWYPEYYIIKNSYLDAIFGYLLHVLPAFIMDGLLVLTGKKPQLIQIYKKFYSHKDTLGSWGLNKWHFRDDNFQKMLQSFSKVDHLAFPIDIAALNWDVYMNKMVRGFRTYLLNDDFETLDKAKKKMKKLMVLHYFVKYTVIFGFLLLFWHYFVSDNVEKISRSRMLALRLDGTSIF